MYVTHKQSSLKHTSIDGHNKYLCSMNVPSFFESGLKGVGGGLRASLVDFMVIIKPSISNFPCPQLLPDSHMSRNSKSSQV